ncbi:hypothetical protein GGX14DRAFT_581895 [Mycena pura]|uniref:BTB domain-containing protein n=1 Tax=Mycena pura TaxID=153505 RepID=A0AAD6YUY2_9AGAR|nr:hypothetical protein GGX14DRAFT_581895 [Mycena pura]
MSANECDAPTQRLQPQPPFDADDADFILRTSDEVDFRVHKLVLSLASPFFKMMFQLPQKEGEANDQLPVVPAAEDSRVVDKLLRFCYPCADPKIETLDELHAVMEAMAKYQMCYVAARAEYQMNAFLDSEPVAVFAICCRFGWLATAKRAAGKSLALPLRDFEHGSTVKELKYMTGEQYQALLQYHWHCSVAATSPLVDVKWLNSDSGWVWWTCQTCVPHPSPQMVHSRSGFGNEARYVRRWFMDFVERAKGILSDCPGGRLDTTPLLTVILKQTHGCQNCRESAFEHIVKFIRNTLMPRVNEELGKVSLNLTV